MRLRLDDESDGCFWCASVLVCGLWLLGVIGDGDGDGNGDGFG